MLCMEDITRMVSRQGFINVFYNRLADSMRNGAGYSRREVYEDMEEEYEAKYGCYQFPSFDAFRKYLSRHIKSNH